MLLHVLTQKGKGYKPAEQEPARFHGTGPFDIETGKPLGTAKKDTYTDIFSKVICDIGKRDPKVAVITAAMADGTGLSEFRRRFPRRFFDVGIAEGHAVTFAAGLAAGGIKPVFAVYSSFLQRGYDQIIHDVGLQNLPVVFAVDRAGLVGSDGETHQGIFDLSYLGGIPNMTVMSPKNRWELADMLRFAVDYDGPVALRYPRGTAYDGCEEFRAPIQYGRSEVIYEEESIAIVSVGHMFEEALKTRRLIKETGYNCTLVNARFVKPVDEQMIEELAKNHSLIVTIEENILCGGFGERVTEYVSEHDLPVQVLNLALPDDYIEHGSVDVLRREVLLDAPSMTKRIVTEYILACTRKTVGKREI